MGLQLRCKFGKYLLAHEFRYGGSVVCRRDGRHFSPRCCYQLAAVIPRSVCAADIFYFPRGIVVEAERLRRSCRHIDDATADIGGPRSLTRTTTERLIDEIGDPHIARQRQRRVRGRKCIHIEGFRRWRSAAVKVFAVPGSLADCMVFDGSLHGVFARIRGGAFAGNTFAFDCGLAGCKHARTDGNGVPAIRPAGDIIGRAVG